MKKSSVFILACCGSRLKANLPNHQSRFRFLRTESELASNNQAHPIASASTPAWKRRIGTLGKGIALNFYSSKTHETLCCNLSQPQNTTRCPFTIRFCVAVTVSLVLAFLISSNVTLAQGLGQNSASSGQIAAPQQVRWGGQAPAQLPGRMAAKPIPVALSRYSVQQATYQYPATNPPGQPPLQIGTPQNGFQLQNQFQNTLPNQPAIQYQPQPPNGIPPFNVPGQGTLLGQGYGLNQPVQTPLSGSFGNNQSGVVPPTTIPPQVGTGLLQPPLQQPQMLDLDVFIPQNPSGRASIGGTYSSDNKLVGQIILEEHDFDLLNPPRNFREAFTSPYAWRGGGQRFRLEAVPGTDLQRYLVSWSDPYFRGSDTSLSLSGYLFDRDYYDWDERRVGGRINFGRRLSQFLSVNAGLRMESVKIDDPRLLTSPQLNANLGTSNLFLANLGLVYDDRVFPYLTGVGTYLGLTFNQAFGDYSYSRGEVDFRNFRTLFARNDQAGRHVLGFRSKLGFTGGDTPVFENFIAGGVTSFRGFDFRGISPINGGVKVGGEFQWLNSVEYTFPITNDDMIYGSAFVDFGTVEQDIKIESDNFRVAPGLGLRVHLPWAGLGAPLSFDFAFPVSTANGDEEKSFSFFVGLIR